MYSIHLLNRLILCLRFTFIFVILIVKLADCQTLKSSKNTKRFRHLYYVCLFNLKCDTYISEKHQKIILGLRRGFVNGQIKTRHNSAKIFTKLIFAP